MLYNIMFIVSGFLGSQFSTYSKLSPLASWQETCDGKDVRSVVKGLGQAVAGREGDFPGRLVCLCVLPFKIYIYIYLFILCILHITCIYIYIDIYILHVHIYIWYRMIHYIWWFNTLHFSLLNLLNLFCKCVFSFLNGVSPFWGSMFEGDLFQDQIWCILYTYIYTYSIYIYIYSTI